MSLFGKVSQALNEELNTRYTALQQHAKNLNVEIVKEDIEDSGLTEGLTPHGLDQLQMIIDRKVDAQTEEPATEAMKKAARDALGITWSKPLETLEDVQKLLRLRKAWITELELAIQSFHEVKNELETKIEKFEIAYGMELEQWYLKNPPENGTKSYKTIFGTIGQRNQPGSAAQDEQSSEAQKQLWLKNMSDADKERFGVEALTVYQANNERLKEWFVLLAKTAKPPECPLYKWTPPKENKFFIGPSLDTVKENLRKQRR